MNKIKDFFKKIKPQINLGFGAILFAIFGSTAIYYKDFVRGGVFIDLKRDLEEPCFIGDTGTGGIYQKKVAIELKANCKDVFFLGDLVYPMGLKNDEDSQFFTKFYDHYHGLNKYLVLGNHDSYNNDNLAWISFSKRYPDVVFPNYFYALKFNDVCVLAFESSIYGVLGKGKFEKEQNRFVKNFTSREDCKTKIAIAHHPYLSSGEHGDASYELRSFYENYLVGKVDFIFAGHDHNLSFEGCFEGTCHYVSGSGSKIRECEGKREYCESELGFVKLKGNLAKFITVQP